MSYEPISLSMMNPLTDQLVFLQADGAIHINSEMSRDMIRFIYCRNHSHLSCIHNPLRYHPITSLSYPSTMGASLTSLLLACWHFSSSLVLYCIAELYSRVSDHLQIRGPICSGHVSLSLRGCRNSFVYVRWHGGQ